MIEHMARNYSAHLLIGDFNQAAPKMVPELKARGMDVYADSHHPKFEDCICIFGFGPKAPGRNSNISVWTHLNGAHWPLARHFGSQPKKTEAGAAKRSWKSRERLQLAKAKAKAKAKAAKRKAKAKSEKRKANVKAKGLEHWASTGNR